MMELLEKFLKFEEEHNLLNSKVHQVPFWHLIRFELYNEIQVLVGNVKINPTKKNKKSENIKRLLFIGKNILNHNPLLYYKKKDILFLNHSRKVKDENGQFQCVYTDTIIENLDISNVTLEDPYLKQHYYPASNSNILYTDYIRIKEKIISIFYTYNLTEFELEKIETIIFNLNKIFNINLSEQTWKAKISKRINSYLIRYKIYNNILDKIQPKLIVEVVSYAHDRFLINHLAKEKNIPTIELQHGTMGEFHVSYNFSNKINISTFPEYILTFGKYWKDYTRLPLKEGNIRVVGWPYFEKKITNSRKKISNERNSRKTVLFISQGTVGKALSEIAVMLNTETNQAYNIIYKLHPAEYSNWKANYPWLLNTDIKVIDHNNHDMHYYFSQSDIQVGVYSTAIFEGLGYGLSTFIIKLYGYEFMKDLLKNNIVQLAIDGKDLAEKITQKKIYNNNFDLDYIWEKDSLSNVIDEIQLIMNESVEKSFGKYN